MNKTTLWAVHIEGPDDIFAMPSESAAQEHCDILNRHWEKRNQNAIGPFLTAKVVPWPYTAEAHAQDMLENLNGEEQ